MQANEQLHVAYWRTCPDCEQRRTELEAQGLYPADVEMITLREHAVPREHLISERKRREIIGSVERALGHRMNEQDVFDLMLPYVVNEQLPSPRERLTIEGFVRLIGALLFLLLILGLFATGALRALGFAVGSDIYCDFLGGPDCSP